MKAVKRMAALAAALVALFALAHPVPGNATSVYINGAFEFSVDWNSIKTSQLPRCDATCTKLRYISIPSQFGMQSGMDELEKWATDPARAEGDAVWAYSLGTQVVTGRLRADQSEILSTVARVAETRPQIQWILLGSPETPGAPTASKGRGGVEGLPTTVGPIYTNVTYVVRQYGSAEDRPDDKRNWLAVINASLAVHIQGYDDIDLDKPDAVYVDPVTGSTTKYFATKVLPILAWRDWFTSDEKMAELDAKYRPLIETAYDRPVDIPNPWAPKVSGKSGTGDTIASTDPHETEIEGIETSLSPDNQPGSQSQADRRETASSEESGTTANLETTEVNQENPLDAPDPQNDDGARKNEENAEQTARQPRETASSNGPENGAGEPSAHRQDAASDTDGNASETNE